LLVRAVAIQAVFREQGFDVAAEIDLNFGPAAGSLSAIAAASSVPLAAFCTKQAIARTTSPDVTTLGRSMRGFLEGGEYRRGSRLEGI